MIIEKARELGLALSETPEFQAMLQAQKALEEDKEISAMVSEFRGMKQEIMDMMTEPDADATLIQECSTHMEEIKNALFESPVFCCALEAQGEFQNLMDIVNREIGACIGVPMSEEDESCSGNCHSCGGCKH